MKNSKKFVFLLAAATLLGACGGNNGGSTSETGSSASSSQEEVTLGASVYGLKIDYASDANLLGVSTLSKNYYAGYVYTPKANDVVYLVPSFAGANELDYIEVGEKRVEAKVGADDLAFNCSGATFNLKGIRYAEFLMPEAATTVKVHSKAVTGATLHTVTLNTTNNTHPLDYYNAEESAWTTIGATNLDSYFKTAGTHTVQVMEGAVASWIIDGADIENFHSSAFDYVAKVDGTVVPHNQLEASIKGLMKTTGSFIMPNKDVTVEIEYKDVYKSGEAYALCHGGSYVAGATVSTVKDHSGNVKILAATLGEALLPSQVQAAENTDAANYVEGDVTSHGTTAKQKWYKEIKFGTYTLTASLTEAGALQYTGADFSTEAVCEAYYKAAMADQVKASGDVTIGSDVLSKDKNGYGGTRFDWKANRNATVAAFQQYGKDACLASTQMAEAGEDGKKYWTVTSGEETVSTGATWTDFNTNKEGYLSYVKVLANAYDKSIA